MNKKDFNGTPEQLALINRWYDMKTQLDDLKAEEMELRKLIIEQNFDPNIVKGTENVIFETGAILKSTKSQKTHFTGTNDEIEAALDEMDEDVALRIVRWKPEVVASEHKMIMEGNTDFHNRHKRILSNITRVVDSAPKLEIVEKKGELPR